MGGYFLQRTNKMRLTVIDWETLGIDPTARVIAVGAVTFNLKSEDPDYKCFDTPISLKGQENRTFSQSTIDWWGQQSPEAKMASLNAPMADKKHISLAMNLLTNFIKNTDAEGILGNGINFDNAILSNLCKEYDIKYPTPYWADHDLRTMRLMANMPKPEWPDNLIQHVAADDAIYEAMCARAYWNTLHGNR